MASQDSTPIADIIRKNEADIIARWLDKARATASARGLPAVALQNVMPLYLSALGDALATGGTETNNRRSLEHVQAHLATRLRQGFDLAEILAEFVLLERTIASIWSTRPPQHWPSNQDIDRLHAFIQRALTDVTDTFRSHMLEDEQSEKRYLRLLQGIASDALHEDAAPLRQRLQELLEVVMEAMSAQCAAFLAYETSTSNLLLAATAGVGALEPHAVSLGPASFEARVATHDEPTAMYGEISTHHDLPESLAHAGINSLLGVRLPAYNDLLGIMYIGIAESREFTPREIGRIASIGERLAVHLENARLFAKLHETIEALAVEKSLRERFVAMLAHDLRGPLAAARLGADLLAFQPTTLDDRRELALKIGHNVERVDRMVRDLLDANRIRAGEQLPLRLDTCDLVALAHRVSEEARAMHGDRFFVETDVAEIVGIWSENELHRSLWNLVTNAVKYGAAKQPITIEVGRQGDGARIAVHNTGPAIPLSEQAHIFDPYARMRSADTGDRLGWGLGLTLVRGVAEAHGGHVSVASDPESGTTFTIDLPLDARVARREADERAGAAVH
jgi:signal transduction histidine kinase